MLRGNDPFQELYRWMRVLFFLMMLALAIGLLATQEPTSYDERHDAVSIGLSLALLGVDLIIPSIAYISILRSMGSFKQQHQQRQHALAGESLPQATAQPAVETAPIALPQRVHPHLRRGFLITPIVLLIIFSIGLILQQIPLFVSNPYQLPDGILELSGALGFLLLIIPVSLLGFFATFIVVGYYMLPSLDIDDTGIAARYGRHMVTLAWRDIRYFAMTNNRLIARPKASTRPFVYEICDGEHIINWAPNMRAVIAYKVDNADYNTLASKQLPALIMARTGLPLLDLRQIK